MQIIGIDPGARGGFCSLRENGQIELIAPLPKTPKDLFDFFSLETGKTDLIFMEQVHGRGGQWGASQGFNFGRNVGMIEMALVASGISHGAINFVPPQTWQRFCHKGVGYADAKKRSLVAAQGILGERKRHLIAPRGRVPHDGMVDAFLIAYYGIHHGNKKG